MEPTTKLSRLRFAASRGDWRGALRIAARFHDLGEQEADIRRAHEAFANGRFFSQIGRDPAALIEAGIRALQARYELGDTNMQTSTETAAPAAKGKGSTRDKIKAAAEKKPAAPRKAKGAKPEAEFKVPGWDQNLSPGEAIPGEAAPGMAITIDTVEKSDAALAISDAAAILASADAADAAGNPPLADALTGAAEKIAEDADIPAFLKKGTSALAEVKADAPAAEKLGIAKRAGTLAAIAAVAPIPPKAAKPAKAPAAKKAAEPKPKASEPKPGSKTRAIYDLLIRPEGATSAEMKAHGLIDVSVEVYARDFAASYGGEVRTNKEGRGTRVWLTRPAG